MDKKKFKNEKKPSNIIFLLCFGLIETTFFSLFSNYGWSPLIMNSYSIYSDNSFFFSIGFYLEGQFIEKNDWKFEKFGALDYLLYAANCWYYIKKRVYNCYFIWYKKTDPFY